jgi:hypothetical protein
MRKNITLIKRDEADQSLLFEEEFMRVKNQLQSDFDEENRRIKN